MKICINTLSAKAGGGVTYLSEMIRNLAVIDDRNDYLVVGLEQKRDVFTVQSERFSFFCFPFADRSTPARMIWEQTRMASWLSGNKVDLLFSPGNFGLLRPGCLQVICLQLPYETQVYANSAYTKFRWIVRNTLTKSSAKSAQRIITVSEDLRQVAHRKFGFPLESMVPIHHGASLSFRRIPPEESSPRLKERFSLEGPFVLCVSDFYVHKNYPNMVRAFSRVREKHPGLGLVIAGRPIDAKVHREVLDLVGELGLGDSVRLLGLVPWEDLNHLYSACLAYVFPSKYETFGLTQLEAMSSGAPVITSSSSVMPEICGDAAVYFDPDDFEEMAGAIDSVVSDDALRAELVHKGRARLDHCSWEKCARQHLEVFESVGRERAK